MFNLLLWDQSTTHGEFGKFQIPSNSNPTSWVKYHSCCTTCCNSFKTCKTPCFPFLLPFGRKASMIDCEILEVNFPSSLGFMFSNKKLLAPTAQSNRSAQFLARCLQLWEWVHQMNWAVEAPEKQNIKGNDKATARCTSIRMLQVLWMKA